MENFKNYRALVLYFSGTGNTHLAAKEIAKTLEDSGLSASVKSTEVFDPEETKNYDLLFFGFPIYALRMPAFLESYAERLTPTRKKWVFIFSTYGFYPGNAMKITARTLARKGFIPIGIKGTMLPGTDGLLFIKKGSKTEEKIKNKDYTSTGGMKKLKEKVSKTIHRILAEEPSRETAGEGISLFLSPIGIILDILFQLIYKPLEKSFKKKFYADQKCTHCRLCELICPSHNITVTQTDVLFSNKCYLCLRCIHQCPEEAIQIGKFTQKSMRYRGPDGSYHPLSILRSHE